jgi:hypothetical protein
MKQSKICLLLGGVRTFFTNMDEFLQDYTTSRIIV